VGEKFKDYDILDRKILKTTIFGAKNLKNYDFLE
jgi:hypothetical protein